MYLSEDNHLIVRVIGSEFHHHTREIGYKKFILVDLLKVWEGLPTVVLEIENIATCLGVASYAPWFFILIGLVWILAFKGLSNFTTRISIAIWFIISSHRFSENLDNFIGWCFRIDIKLLQPHSHSHSILSKEVVLIQKQIITCVCVLVQISEELL